jgi:hypothetical protein
MRRVPKAALFRFGPKTAPRERDNNKTPARYHHRRFSLLSKASYNTDLSSSLLVSCFTTEIVSHAHTYTASGIQVDI